MPLAAGNRANDDEWLLAGCDRVGQRGVGRLVGKILLAGEEAQESAALLRVMVADGTAQHGIVGLEGVEHGALRDWARNLDRYLAADVRQGAEMWREYDADHRTYLTTDRLRPP